MFKEREITLICLLHIIYMCQIITRYPINTIAVCQLNLWRAGDVAQCTTCTTQDLHRMCEALVSIPSTKERNKDFLEKEVIKC